MIFLYITCKDIDEAKKIGRELIDKKVAQCVNIAPIFSIWRGDEGVKEGEEASLIVKTLETKVQEVEDVVRGIHSYNVPCIASFSTYRINREYKDWLLSRG